MLLTNKLYQSKSKKISYVSREVQIENKHGRNITGWFNGFYSEMFSLDFDCIFFFSRARNTRSADFKSLARLLPEYYIL